MDRLCESRRGTAVHYLCDEKSDWYPDIDDMRKKITDRTVAIVLINPNNPTGALYPKEMLQQIVDLAREHQLMIFSDESTIVWLWTGSSIFPSLPWLRICSA